MSNKLDAVMAEGLEKTREAMELMKKQVAEIITPAEETRLATLDDNLLALAGQAVDLGFNPDAVLAQTKASAEEISHEELLVQ